MERGIILINKTRKGFEAKCDLANGKPPIVLVGFGITEDMAGKECQIEREKGQPVRVVIDGKEFRKGQATAHRGKTSPQQRFNSQWGGGRREGPASDRGFKESSGAPHPDNAHAPYNFIPLHERPVPFSEQSAREQDRWRESSEPGPGGENRYCGSISLRIEAKTPLYIRGTSTNPAAKDQAVQDYFAPGGILRIPGSSLRGMIRTLVEIASCGVFGEGQTNTKKRLYYRSIGDMSELRNIYTRDMIDTTNHYFPRVKAGVLRRENQRLVLYPSAENMGTQIYRVNGSFDAKNCFTVAGTTIVMKEFTFRVIYFRPVGPTNHTHYRGPQGNQVPYSLRYALVKDVSDTPAPRLVKGYLICSGRFGRKKHMQWIINAPIEPGIPVPEAVEADYRDDSNRKEDADLLSMLREHDEVPCFYIPESDNPDTIRAIGHTGLFRLPYRKTIGDHIPPALKQNSLVDCAGAVFGLLDKWAGRVAFEDALLVGGQAANVLMEPTSPKILSGPKPTTFQHYLEPDGGRPQHWDTSANLRGYKLYWHRRTPESGRFSWSEGRIMKDSQHTAVIQPVKEGTRFVGKIRFDNLTKEELGALLFVLDLPPGCHHRLGMGKPLGLGSVAVTPALCLIDRKRRYEEVFSGGGWQLAERSEERTAFIHAFEEFMLKNMAAGDRNGAASLWETPRMRELREMLDWNKAVSGGDGWLEKTRYMEIEHPTNKNEFRMRPVLKPPTGI